MGLFKLKTVVVGLSSVLAASSLLFAAAAPESLLDGQFDDNQNNFEFYWYYYDDNAGIGANDRPQAATPGSPSVINVDFVEKPRAACATDNHTVKDYTFKTDGTDDKFATMPFTFGDSWTASYGAASPYVGIGTMLNDKGKKLDLTGATSIKFKIKSRVGPLTVRFKVQTQEVDEISEITTTTIPAPFEGDEFGYYGKEITVSTTWKEEEVIIPTDLALPGKWARDIAFNIASATKLAWEVSKGFNTSVTSDTLDIDDITIVGYTFVSPSVWTKTETDFTLPDLKGLISTFDVAPYNESTQGYYWYAYNDAAIGGTSVVSSGATLDEETKLLTLDWADGTGSQEQGQGIQVEYLLGPTIDQNGTPVQGFVGVGINTYDSAKVEYWDAAADGATDIYFHYATLGDLSHVTLEISDMNDVGDATTPDRKDSRGSGVVYYRNFPATNGEWKVVRMPLDSLVWHSGWEGAKEIPFDKTKIAKLQWKVQGGEGKGGLLAIDNVFFPGATLSSPIKHVMAAAKKPVFDAMYLNGSVHINWSDKTSILNGSMSLVNTQGKVLAAAPILKANKFTTDFSAKKLPAGMYFVKMDAISAQGKVINSQFPITIVK